MPDHSFSEAKPPIGFHPAIKAFAGVEQKSGFPSFTEPRPDPWRAHPLPAHQPEFSALLRPLTFHAEPLSPMRQRDEQALEDLFAHGPIEDIVSDICDRLKQLYPEPCWEEEAFDFLKAYL
ncbi:hypothetical protein [Leptothoe sp. PORK10 BA2]|uniref:hypothetical protein n=1 Tax=Leptothoe sp. PORK10 BA2 TaxID=3110254 RepID=UPI002B1F13CB|nr:hypothetical protein [Leptothoe sp. PORK10 BA2]MEA5466083.1 hypothetical protein [Leptothoe sp. PORK10 BA2]